MEIREHFLKFTKITDCTGAGMTAILIKKLGELEIDMRYMRGQGYDNGSNMKGTHDGVQKRT